VPASAALSSPQDLLLLSLNYQGAKADFDSLNADLKQKQDAAKVLDAQLTAQETALEKALDVGKTDQAALNDLVGKINSALSEADQYLQNPFAKKVVSEHLAATLQSIIDATGPSNGSGSAAGAGSSASTASDLTAKLRAGLAVVQAVAGVEDAFANRIPHPNTLAIERAQMSYSRDIADSQIADLKTQISDASAQLNAITTAAYFLSRSKTELLEAEFPKPGVSGLVDFIEDPKTQSPASRHVTAALYFYASAWNRGVILADEIGVSRRIAARRAILAQSQRAAKAWTDSLGPALDTLVDYGKGGIDPKTVAQLLGGAGLVATGVGANK
jgi:hypothetical protein